MVVSGLRRKIFLTPPLLLNIQHGNCFKRCWIRYFYRRKYSLVIIPLRKRFGNRGHRLRTNFCQRCADFSVHHASDVGEGRIRPNVGVQLHKQGDIMGGREQCTGIFFKLVKITMWLFQFCPKVSQGRAQSFVTGAGKCQTVLFAQARSISGLCYLLDFSDPQLLRSSDPCVCYVQVTPEELPCIVHKKSVN